MAMQRSRVKFVMEHTWCKSLYARVIAGLLLLPFAMQIALAGDRGEEIPSVCSRVQIFYYDWYGAPPMQKSFIHWPQGGHVPPEDIGSNYYPMLGAYSSTDPAVLKKHMEWIRRAGAGVLVVTWWGRESYTDQNAKDVLDAAADAGLKVAFHIEPYPGRTPMSVADDVSYILRRYGTHPAFYRTDFGGRKALFYVFESVRSSTADWQRGNRKIHSGSEPVMMIAQTSNVNFVRDGEFDGGYTYDGLAPFKHAGFSAHWQDVERSFEAAGKVFIPSVGPGYWDDRAVEAGGADEPEAARTRDKATGRSYDRVWNDAIDARPPIITITSFNEWHEGSQIEPAVEHTAGDYQFPSYGKNPFEYLNRTARHVQQYKAIVGCPQ